jgi:hypothetical protein
MKLWKWHFPQTLWKSNDGYLAKEVKYEDIINLIPTACANAKQVLGDELRNPDTTMSCGGNICGSCNKPFGMMSACDNMCYDCRLINKNYIYG